MDVSILILIVVIILLSLIFLWYFLYQKSNKSEKIFKLSFLSIAAFIFSIVWLFLQDFFYKEMHEGECCSACAKGQICTLGCEACPDPLDYVIWSASPIAFMIFVVLTIRGILFVISLKKKNKTTSH